jgi:anti-sigma factor RsiW
MTCDEARDLLGALVDGELAAGERAEVSGHLNSCPACAAEFKKLKALSSALRAAPYYPAPADRRENIRRALRGDSSVVPAWRSRVAPGLVGVLVGFACALFFLNPGIPPTSDFVARHSEALLSGDVVAVKSSDHHQVKPWFSRHVDFSPPLPELAADGFPLEGGRTASFNDGTAAVLVYQRNLHVIDVFVRPAAGGDAPARKTTERGFNVLSWRRNGFNFTAVSDLNAEELSRFVDLMRSAGS